MHSGVLFILSIFIIYVTAQNRIPAGFIPLPPLPVQTAIAQQASTSKVTPKPTLAPVTKKPTTKKAQFKPTTTKPSLPPSSGLPPSSRLPPSSTIQVATKKPACGMNINVPSANCNGANSAVQQTLNTLKQELDKTRQQHQAQNVAVQSMITKLQSQQSGYLTKISDLQNEVQNLVKAFNALSSSRPISTPASVTVRPTVTGVSNTFIQQAVQNVRNDMNQAVSDINNKVFNLSTVMLNNQQQESKVHQSIEAQIQQQARDVGKLTQQVTDLNRLLQQLNTSTGSTGSGATSADIAKLQARINQVAADLKVYDKNQQSQFSSLNLRTGSLLAIVSNHTNQIRGVQTGVAIAQAQINKVDRDITVVHDALAQFRKTTIPRMNQLDNDVKGLKTDVASAQTSVGNVGKTVFKLVTQIGSDSAKLQSLEKQANQLQTDIAKIQSDLNAQNTEINAVKSGMTSLKNAIPTNELNKMNNNVLQILSLLKQGNSPTKAQLQDLTNAITTITNKLGNLNVAGSPSG